MERNEVSGPKLPETPGAWESRAFFAALIAAIKGDDEKAAEILRSIADSMTGEFVKSGGSRKSRG